MAGIVEFETKGLAEGDDEVGLPLIEKQPQFYLPWLQFAMRILLGTFAGLYFCWRPVRPAVFSEVLFFLFFTAYFCFHFVWWRRYRRQGMGATGIRVASWVDLVCASMALLNDSFPVPPTACLVFMVVLGNGVQHGLHVFVELLVGSIMVCAAVLPIRQLTIGGPPPYNFVFLLLFLVTGLHYAYMLITRVEEVKDEAVRQSARDALTGMLNREAFSKVANYLLSLHMRTELPLTVMFADMDKFKDVNDQWGHAVGDDALKQFARIVGNSCRETDVSGRYGGDEFVFMLVDTGAEQAQSLAHRLRREFSEWARKRNLAVSISFGVAPVPAKCMEIGEILREADLALYDAKQDESCQGVAMADMEKGQGKAVHSELY